VWSLPLSLIIEVCMGQNFQSLLRRYFGPARWVLFSSAWPGPLWPVVITAQPSLNLSGWGATGGMCPLSNGPCLFLWSWLVVCEKRALPWNSVKCVIFINFNTFGFICESLQTTISTCFYTDFVRYSKRLWRYEQNSSHDFVYSSVTDTNKVMTNLQCIWTLKHFIS